MTPQPGPTMTDQGRYGAWLGVILLLVRMLLPALEDTAGVWQHHGHGHLAPSWVVGWPEIQDQLLEESVCYAMLMVPVRSLETLS